MTIDTLLKLKTEVERLSDLEEQLAHAAIHAAAGDAGASAERLRLLDEIEEKKMAIRELEATQ